MDPGVPLERAFDLALDVNGGQARLDGDEVDHAAQAAQTANRILGVALLKVPLDLAAEG